MKINCDIGERGVDHPVDLELMRFVDIANIACGGHAGDVDTIRIFREMADDHDVMVSAHLSYPDRQHVGRRSLELAPEELCRALDDQYALMSDVNAVKFHGALYNDSVTNAPCASTLARWCKSAGVGTVLGPADSEIAVALHAEDVMVIPEAFADRRYGQDPVTGRLTLVDRSVPGSVMETLELALEQCRDIAMRGEVKLLTDAEDDQQVSIAAETLCIHSDSAIALSLARALVEEEWNGHADA